VANAGRLVSLIEAEGRQAALDDLGLAERDRPPWRARRASPERSS
jgi:hypothetical protein